MIIIKFLKKPVGLILGNRYNKAFKSDSQRVALLICVGLSDYGALQRVMYCVVRTLTRRYVFSEMLHDTVKLIKLLKVWAIYE